MNREKRMVELREQGWSYREIANNFGLSRQRVYQIIGKRNISYFKKVTEKQCVFKGIRDYMNRTATSLAELLRKIYGVYHPETCSRFRQYLNGRNEMSMSTINGILKATGLTYEQAFLEKESNNEL